MREWTKEECTAAYDKTSGCCDWRVKAITLQCEVTALRKALEDALVVIKCSNSSGQNTCDHCRVETEKFRALLNETK